MTPDLLTRFHVDDTLLYPPFARKWGQAISLAAEEGCEVYRVCGTRFYAEQTTDFLKGRQTPGPNATPQRPLGDTVTNARAGESVHCFGIGGDGTRDVSLTRPGLQPDYDPAHYEPYARYGKALGLDMGFYWPGKLHDAAHAGLNIAAKGLTLHMLRVVFERRGRTDERAGLADVFAYLDQHGPWP